MSDMNKSIPITEQLKKTHKTIDQLNTFNGIKLLLEDQKDSITAINKIIKNLTFVVDEIFSFDVTEYFLNRPEIASDTL